MDEAKNQINDLEHKEEDSVRTARSKNNQKNHRLRSLWDNFKRTNILIIGETGERERARN